MIEESMTAPSSAAPASLPWTRTFWWLLRRELWEHRSVWIAPAAVAGFTAVVHFISTLTFADADRAATLADPAKADDFMALYGGAGMAVVVTGLLVGALYSLEALRTERRDRSVLFWKSLPVSDRLTVLSKAAVPLVVIPAVVLVLVVAQTTAMVVLQSIVWSLDGFDPRQLWARLDLPFMWLALAYALPFMVLWYAPIYAWFLLVSAWARRVAVLWALAPFVAVLLVEHTALHRTHAHWVLEKHVAAGFTEPFSVAGKGWVDRLSDLDPLRLYTLPGLWTGLVLAALLLFAAIRLRRSRPPT